MLEIGAGGSVSLISKESDFFSPSRCAAQQKPGSSSEVSQLLRSQSSVSPSKNQFLKAASQQCYSGETQSDGQTAPQAAAHRSPALSKFKVQHSVHLIQQKVNVKFACG